VNSRPQPHSIEAERSVLGAMLLDEDALHEGLAGLTSDHFSINRHRCVFDGLQRLFEEREGVDVITLGETLKRTGTYDDAGGIEYVLELVADVSSPGSFGYHINVVLDKYLLRQLISIASKINESAFAGKERANLLVDQAESLVFNLSQQRVRRDFVAVGDFVKDVYAAIEERARRQEHIHGLETGYTELDDLTGGFHRQEFIVLASRPGQGKTALALNVAQYVALRQNLPVAVFSLEMSREQVAMRILCAEARVDLHRVRTGRIAQHEWVPLTDAIARLSVAPIYIDDSPAISVLELRAKARRLKSRYDVELVIVDYLQLVRGTRQAENRQQEIAEVSMALKALAKELRVPVLACAQLSRAPTQRPRKEPQLSDLRESGAIEQDADVVLFIYYPHERRTSQEEDEEERRRQEYFSDCELIIAKQRNGPTDRIPLRFIKKYTRFEHRAYVGRAETPVPAEEYDF
jgi:replicative DNA helicase